MMLYMATEGGFRQERGLAEPLEMPRISNSFDLELPTGFPRYNRP